MKNPAFTYHKFSHEEFQKIAKQHLYNVNIIASATGLNPSTVKRRLSTLRSLGIDTTSKVVLTKSGIKDRYKGRINFSLQDGRAIIFSDAHYYPDNVTTAHKALVSMIKHFKPELVVCNGDAFDGSSISRHPRIGWDDKPTVKQELEAVKERLGEIEAASKGKLIWTLGNHDARFETFLAANAPQMEGIEGFHLKDHFPRWIPAWSVFINDDVVVKHRWKGGIHATHGNTSMSGRTMVTGHLHSLKVTPYTDYNGTRYGVDCGTLAVPYGEQFQDYCEDAPVNWRSGFVMLTFKGGKLLQPELIQVHDEEAGIVDFRGELIQI